MAFSATSPNVWTPPIAVDLDAVSPAGFDSALDDLKRYFNERHAADHAAVPAGWHVVTPQIALAWLARQRGNRKVVLKTVQKYAKSMAKGRWRRTGQGVVFDSNGALIEGQHRLLASLLSGASFETYVVTDASAEPDIFAYLDNGKVRTPADALFTSGANGCSKEVAQAVRVAIRWEAGGYRVTSMPRMPEPEPADVMDYVAANPDLLKAAHILYANFKKAAKLIGNQGVAVFVTWQIMSRYGMAEAQEFFLPLITGANLAEDSPILALRDRLNKFDEEDSSLSQQQRLALCIKAFAMAYVGDVVVLKRTKKKGQQEGLYLADNEPFPQFPPAALDAAGHAAD